MIESLEYRIGDHVGYELHEEEEYFEEYHFLGLEIHTADKLLLWFETSESVVDPVSTSGYFCKMPVRYLKGHFAQCST
jgi:hypothetical protein